MRATSLASARSASVGWLFGVLCGLALASPAVAATRHHIHIASRAIHHLSGDVYEYDYTVSTGSGPFHAIGLHRVVQVRGGEPVVARNGVFLVHGDVWDFNAAFRGGMTPSRSIAVDLATRGLDVWGIDLGWTLVPAGTTDFSFMRDWGLQRDIDDIEAGLRFARSVRASSGSSANRLALLTWSRGGWIGYALLNEEAKRPESERQVRAFIPVDTYFKVNNDAERFFACTAVQSIEQSIASGVYVGDNRVFAELGRVAAEQPEAPSHIFGPPFTNLQASLNFGAAAFHFGSLVTPWYHYVSGYFPGGDTDVIPTGLRYTSIAAWNGFLMSGSPYEPARLALDTWGIACAQGTTGTFGDDLAGVTVPILYVGAAGGFGTSGLYSLGLLGSHDVTTHIVRTLAPGQERFDFGHVDLFYARNAQRLVWAPVADWLREHGPS